MDTGVQSTDHWVKVKEDIPENMSSRFGRDDLENTDSHSEGMANPHENMDIQSINIKQEPTDQEGHSPDLDISFENSEKIDLINKTKKSETESFDNGSSNNTPDINSDQTLNATLKRQPEKIFYQGSQVCQITQNNFCLTCNKWFSSIGHLNEHMSSDKGTSDKNSIGSLKRDAGRHMVTHNDKIKCTLCNKVFQRQIHLNTHMVTHSNERPFKCSMCDKGFKLKAYLESHMLTHSDTRSFKCHMCDKSFKLRSTIEGHILTHSDKRPFECHLCDKRFKAKSHMESHLLTHSDNRPFKCDVCYKGFKQKGSAKKHMIKHSDERPFKCTVCAKGFKDSAKLKRHISTHPGERPFKCTVCAKGFKDSTMLRRHISIHSDEVYR